ncbi:MAG TPA: RDD family protein [Longimicrobium sp.]|nr:RDD family protein [Longimicrobium sp.]
MDPQNQGTRPETQAGPGYPPPVYAQAQPLAGTQPDIVKRGLACFIDFCIAGAVYWVVLIALGIVLGRLGAMAAGLAGFVAVLGRDVALQGRSPGKKIFGLAAVNASGGPITVEQSARRNITLSLGMLSLAVRPVPVLGFILSGLLSLGGLLLSLYEIYLVATNKPRLGDQLAGTHVVVAGQPAIAV